MNRRFLSLKKIFILVCLLMTVGILGRTVLAQSRATINCVDGMATVPLVAAFPCQNVGFEAIVPTNFIADPGMGTISGTGADLWGWSDDADPARPNTVVEYALVANSFQTSFVDVTNPAVPEVVAVLPAPNNADNFLWRDVKTLGDYALIVGDFNTMNTHGVQIFDLTKLRGLADGIPATITVFDATTDAIEYTGTEDEPIDTAHNIVTNEDTGFAYAVGAGSCAGGLHMIDMTDPLNPTFAGCFDEDGYTHDAQCVVYHGPDEAYTGREICVNSNEDTVTVVDVTDKSNPVMLSRETYPGVAYAHQGWLTEDQAYFILGDELDETGGNGGTTTYLWNMTDLDNIQYIGSYIHPTLSTDHNLYVKDGLVYQANYTAGLRILDLTQIADGILTEVGYFDASPGRDEPATSGGSWSVYPYFESGTIIINELEKGLIVLSPELPNFDLTQSITLPARDDVPGVGETVSYRADLTNTGTAAATGVTVRMEVNGVDVLMSGPTSIASGATAAYTVDYVIQSADCPFLSANARASSDQNVGRRVDTPLRTNVCVPLAVGMANTAVAQQSSPVVIFVGLFVLLLTAVAIGRKRVHSRL